MSDAKAFRKLAENFRAVESNNDHDGAYYLSLQEAHGGRLVWQLLQDGRIPKLPVLYAEHCKAEDKDYLALQAGYVSEWSIYLEGLPVAYDNNTANVTKWQKLWLSVVVFLGNVFVNKFPAGLGLARDFDPGLDVAIPCGENRIFRGEDWKGRRLHDAMVADEMAEMLESEVNGKQPQKPKGKRGPKPKADHPKHKQVVEMWDTGDYAKYIEIDDKLGLGHGVSEMLLERERGRRRSKKK